MSGAKEPFYALSFKFRKVLVPIDGSEYSLLALDFALDMAQRYGSKIVVLHVHSKGASEEKMAEAIMERARKRASKFSSPVEYKVRAYDPSESSLASEIVKEALEGGYDAVVMGARGTSISEEVQIGSTALAVVTGVPATIVLVR
uniref:Universal stress protein n=1 Tax=Fervidicoccus fontis TaxID=683846 RepID=A0A7J3ZN67_9CREN